MPDPTAFDPLFGLSEEDVLLLREVIADRRSARDRTQGRQPPARQVPQTPEVFLALAPSGGLPALDTGAGTGSPPPVAGTGTTDALAATPGSAECELYFLDTSGDAPAFTRFGETARTVYNLSDAAVDAGTWFLVHRDKHGEWFASVGGGAEEVEFETRSQTFTCLTDVLVTDCGFSFTRTTYTVEVSVPVGGTFTISGASGTGTGTTDDETVDVTFTTRELTIPVLPITATINPTTCEVTFTAAEETICVPVAEGCCPGTGS